MILFTDADTAYVLERYDEISIQDGGDVYLRNYSRNEQDPTDTNSYSILIFLSCDGNRPKEETYEIDRKMFEAFRNAVKVGRPSFDFAKAYDDAVYQIEQRKQHDTVLDSD